MKKLRDIGQIIATSIGNLNSKNSNDDSDIYDDNYDIDEDYDDDNEIFNYYDASTCISCGQSLSNCVSYLPWEDGNNEYAYIQCSNCGCKNLFEG